MTLKFTKMHGLGNDFLVLDGVNQSIQLSAQQIQLLGNRHTGVGFDQCLLIESSNEPGVDFNYRIFNADGQEVGQCGNGARCLALFVNHYGLSTKKSLVVATKTTRMKLHINSNDSISVDMGIPKLAPAQIPLQAKQQEKEYSLRLAQGPEIKVHAINVGNPHAVLVVPDINKAAVQELGPQISLHPDFPQQTNTGFMQIIDQQHIQLRVFERGCGETNACGSGAVAAAAIGRLYYSLAEQIQVSLPGGDLTIAWKNINEPIILTGPAALVYEGTLFD